MKYLLLPCFLCAALTAESHNPIRKWDFNSIEQHDNNLVEGVNGQALMFDGYATEINDELELEDTKSLTITAWIAPQEYSWNMSAVVNQQNDMASGFFLGIDDLGRLNGGVSVGSEWINCVSEKSLPLLKWSHISMTIESNKSLILYINGKEVGSKMIKGELQFTVGTGLTIGKTQNKLVPMGTERASSKAVDRFMYFDGLIDELAIYDKVISANEIAKIYASIDLKQPQPLQFRTMPSGTDAERPFGAYYTKLEYAPGWDNLWRGSDTPDIVVRFGEGNPTKLVFWRGTGYIPALVTENNIWMTDQSIENWGTGECYEAMGDKQCRYSNVRIIENTPARIVVHWRYALAGIKHQIFGETEYRSGDWVDEYWSVYPDGVVARNQILWSDFHDKYIRTYQFQETIFFNQPGTKPQDNINDEALTFIDMDGVKASYSWANGAPKAFDVPQYKPIEWVNTKSVYKPFGIYYSQRVTEPFPFGWTEGYSKFPCWNHWPVSQIASDGRKTRTPDKASHSSLTHINGDRQIYERRADNSVRVRSLVGLTTKAADTLLPLARSWNNPATVDGVIAPFTFIEYDQYQRCYRFENSSNNPSKLEFNINASELSPIENLALEVCNWGDTTAKIWLNGKKITLGTDYYIGYLPCLDSDKLIIWINCRSTNSVHFKIE